MFIIFTINHSKIKSVLPKQSKGRTIKPIGPVGIKRLWDWGAKESVSALKPSMGGNRPPEMALAAGEYKKLLWEPWGWAGKRTCKVPWHLMTRHGDDSTWTHAESPERPNWKFRDPGMWVKGSIIGPGRCSGVYHLAFRWGSLLRQLVYTPRKKVIRALLLQCVIHGPAALASPGIRLEIQNLRPQSRPTKLESAFYLDVQMIPI